MERKRETNKNLKAINALPRKPWRSITLENDVIWGWKLKGAKVMFLTPTGRVVIPIDTAEFLGISAYTLERLIYKGNPPQIEPYYVRMWIVSGFSMHPLNERVMKLIPAEYLNKEKTLI